MQSIKNLFSCDSNVKNISPLTQDALVRKINTWLGNVNAIEENYKQAQGGQVPAEQEQLHALKVRELRLDSINALKSAFLATLNEIAKARIDPVRMPREIAALLAEIIGRYGIKCYADNNLPDPFQSSLSVLQTAMLMEEYVLGLADCCPDLSHLHGIDDLFKLKHVQDAHTHHAEFVMDKMVARVWSEKAVELSPSHLVLLSKTLRYINGCLRNIKPDLARHQKLIDTAIDCLRAGANTHPMEKAQINNELAEVKYNDLTEILKAKAELHQQQGKQELAEMALKLLNEQWDECVALSDDPELMLPRCLNKRLFVEKMTPEQELIQRNRALELHLARPKECQRPILIALAWHHLSLCYQKLGKITEAVKCVIEALKLTSRCLARGENNVDLVKVRQNAEQLAEKLSII